MNQRKESNKSSGRDVRSLVELQHHAQNRFIDATGLHIVQELLDFLILFLKSDRQFLQENENTIQECDEGASIATTFNLSHLFHLVDLISGDKLVDILEEAAAFRFLDDNKSRWIVNIEQFGQKVKGKNWYNRIVLDILFEEFYNVCGIEAWFDRWFPKVKRGGRLVLKNECYRGLYVFMWKHKFIEE